MKNIIYLLIGIIAFISSCKPSEVTGDGGKKTEKFVLRKMMENAIDFDWFSAKIKANYQGGEESFVATLQVKIEKDQKIWISGQKFGLEGVRMLIDQDSIRILNRLKRTYQVADFSYIEEEFNLPANFEAVQDLLVGNPLKIGENTTYEFKETELLTLLIGVNNNLRATYSLDNVDYNLASFMLEETTENRKVSVKQLEYEATEKHGDFSNLREITLESAEANASVIMTYSRVEFDEEKSMSFSVPSSYERL